MITQFPDLSDIPSTPTLPPRPLLTPHPDLPGDYVLQVDNTTMEIFQTCPRSAFYYCIKRRQKGARAPLIFGGAIHEGLESLYRLGYHHPDNLNTAKLAVLEHFQQNSYEACDTNWRTPSLALEVIDLYFNHYSLADSVTPFVNPSTNEPFIEKPFALNIGTFELNTTLPFTVGQLCSSDDPTPLHIKTLHIQWTGKIDIAALFNNSLAVVDHKTTSMGGVTFYQEFELSQQTHGYCWALSKILNRPCLSFYLNALIIRKPTRTGRSVEFDRRQYFYSQSQINEWHTDILASCENFVHALIHNSFPKYTKWCVGKYGLCQYFPVCTTPPDNRHMSLASSEFANVTWSPLH
jgi:hypothetical protein